MSGRIVDTDEESPKKESNLQHGLNFRERLKVVLPRWSDVEDCVVSFSLETLQKKSSGLFIWEISDQTLEGFSSCPTLTLFRTRIWLLQIQRFTECTFIDYS